MSLPKYNELYLPFLTVIQDGAVYSTREIKAKLASYLCLSEDDLSLLLSNSMQSVWSTRVGWANTYLKKAGLVIAPKKGHCQITDEGKRLLESDVDITNHYLQQHYPAFEAFVKGKKSENTDSDATVQRDASEHRRKHLSESIPSSMSSWQMNCLLLLWIKRQHSLKLLL